VPRILPDCSQAVRRQYFSANTAGQQLAMRQQVSTLFFFQLRTGLFERRQQAFPMLVELGRARQTQRFDQALMPLVQLGANGHLFRRVDAVGQPTQQIGDARQRGNDHQNLFAFVKVPPDLFADGAPTGNGAHAGAAELHHDPLTARRLLHVLSSKRKRPPLGRPFNSCRAGCGLRR
jgi:hypothetical protein